MSRVLFNREALLIEIDGDYQVDLETCTNSAKLLDWILQIASKPDYAPLVPEFVGQIEKACREVFNDNAQGVFCPFGVDRQVDWKNGTSQEK